MMVMPSGRRSSEPGPMAITSGTAPSIDGQRRHQDRTEALQAGFVNGGCRRQPAPAFAVEREVHHHDAVLLDDADQQNNADEGDHRQFGVGNLQRQQRAEARRRQRRDDGERMRQALVQNAEHDIDRDQRRQQQQRLRADRLLEGFDVAGEVGVDNVGNMHLRHRLPTAPR